MNWSGQQRADVPHLRLIEEAVAGDFDALAGRMLAGDEPLILRGFEVLSAGVSQASQLVLRVAGGLLLHPTASDGGTVYSVPLAEADEPLGPSNPRVVGAFAPNQVNFVGVDLVRQADDSTTDLAMFLSTATGRDSPRSVPLGRVLTRRIVITTLDPSAVPSMAPVARVVTDSANNVTSVVDARNRLFRLGSGGGSPDQLHAYPWAAGRFDATDFSGAGDKQITDLKTFLDALMTRVWELGTGERWFSATSPLNVTLTGSGLTFGTTGEYFEWTGTNLHWQGLAFLFVNSTGSVNEIADQTVDSAGLTDLADGECVYADVDWTQNRTGGSALTMAKAPLLTLGSPTVPGSRIVIAWRRGANVYFRGKVAPVGAVSVPIATTSVAGIVLLSGPPAVPLAPRVATLNSSGAAIAAGLTRKDGTGLGAGAIAIAPNTADTAVTYGHGALAGGHTFDALPGSAPAVLLRDSTDVDVTNDTVVQRWRNNQGGTMKTVLDVLGSGGLSIPLRLRAPLTPATDVGILSMRTNGLSSPNRRLQVVVRWPDGSEGVMIESEPS